MSKVAWLPGQVLALGHAVVRGCGAGRAPGIPTLPGMRPLKASLSGDLFQRSRAGAGTAASLLTVWSRVCAHMCTCAHVCVHVWLCMCHACARVLTSVYLLVCVLMCMPVCMLTHVCSHMCASLVYSYVC